MVNKNDKKEEFFQVITGLRISLKVLVNSNIIDYTIFFAILMFMTLFFLSFFIFPESGLSYYTPYIVSLSTLFFFMFLYISDCIRACKFNFLKGFKVYIFSKYALVCYPSLILSIIGMIVLVGVYFFQSDSFGLYYSWLLLDIIGGLFFTLCALLFFIAYLLYFKIIAKDAIEYTINLLNEILERKPPNNIIFGEERSKIFYAYVLTNELYKRQSKFWYGTNLENVWRFNKLMKLAHIITIVENSDLKVIKKMKKILIEIRDIKLSEKPNKFIIKMDEDIEELAKQYEINSSLNNLNLTKHKIRKYVIILVFIINLLLAISNYFLKL